MANKSFYLYFLLSFLFTILCASVCFSDARSNVKWDFYGKSKTGSNYYYSITGPASSADVVSVWSYKTVTDDEKNLKIESLKKENPEEAIKYRDYAYSIPSWTWTVRKSSAEPGKLFYIPRKAGFWMTLC